MLDDNGFYHSSSTFLTTPQFINRSHNHTRGLTPNLTLIHPTVAADYIQTQLHYHTRTPSPSHRCSKFLSKRNYTTISVLLAHPTVATIPIQTQLHYHTRTPYPIPPLQQIPIKPITLPQSLLHRCHIQIPPSLTHRLIFEQTKLHLWIQSIN